MGHDIWVLIPLAALSIPITAILSAHYRRIAEIKAQMRTGLSDSVHAELEEVKKQVAALRDTTTRFDLSFDAALSHLENRMNLVEQKSSIVNTRYTPEPPIAPVVETVVPVVGTVEQMVGR